MPLVVDNTIATPYLIRPLEWGADVVIHSATKYLGGHGTSIAGVIVDGGTFDYGKDPEKFPNYNTPEESYHGLVFARDLGVGGALGANLAYILKARVQLLRDLGSAISPFNAFLIAQGVETLSLRVERHIENARQVAAYLEAHPQVESVRWASLDSSPSKALADKYAPKGAGAVLAFEISGGLEAGQRFVEGLSLHSHVANIGDVRSLAIHPASTTHSQGGDEDRLAAGVTPGLVRLAVGIESIKDILTDLDAGFAAAGGPASTGDDRRGVRAAELARGRHGLTASDARWSLTTGSRRTPRGGEPPRSSRRGGPGLRPWPRGVGPGRSERRAAGLWITRPACRRGCLALGHDDDPGRRRRGGRAGGRPRRDGRRPPADGRPRRRAVGARAGRGRAGRRGAARWVAPRAPGAGRVPDRAG